MVLSLRADHRRRLVAIEQEKGERRAARASRRASSKASKTVQQGVQESSGTVQDVSSTGRLAVQRDVQDVSGTVLDAVNVSKRERKAAVLDAMLAIYLDSPETGVTAVAGQLGIGRSTVYGYLVELEQAGRVKRNGNGVKVLQ